jgi:hypothetical protein
VRWGLVILQVFHGHAPCQGDLIGSLKYDLGWDAGSPGFVPT